MTEIMVVDDEPDIIYMLKVLLEKEGHEVIEAYSGRECLEKLKIEKPDLILLDIVMPKMDGWETLKAIKEDGNLKSIPVVMLTAKALPIEMEREDVKGVADYITKPFTKEDLIETFRQFCDLG